MEYRVISYSTNDIEGFQEEVEAALNAGWQLEAFTVTVDDDIDVLYQTISRRKP